jgi:hypothetical protein
MPDPIKKSCSRKYRAYHTSGTRSKGAVTMIVMHDEESTSAVGAAVWFTNPASGGSAHLCVDDYTCYRTLDPADVPWGASSAPQISANYHGWHIEQAGYAKWSGVVWLSHLRTLKRAAWKTAVWAQYFSIPIVFLTKGDLILGKRHGITTHYEISMASKVLDPAHAYKYTHTDPGPFWPRSTFMWLVKHYAKEL